MLKKMKEEPVMVLEEEIGALGYPIRKMNPSFNTPGPWKMRDSRTNENEIWVDCYAFANKGKGKMLSGTICTVHDCGEKAEANARLIAASPTLLKELEYADKIISILLNALPQEEGQPTRLEVYKKICSIHDGDGVVRSQERSAAIKSAKGE